MEVSEVLIAMVMEAGRISENSVNFYQTTWSNKPEDSHLHTRCCKSLKYHQGLAVLRSNVKRVSFPSCVQK
jgi:hypothetical protein